MVPVIRVLINPAYGVEGRFSDTNLEGRSLSSFSLLVSVIARKDTAVCSNRSYFKGLQIDLIFIGDLLLFIGRNANASDS